jgi:hypothetical protein
MNQVKQPQQRLSASHWIIRSAYQHCTGRSASACTVHGGGVSGAGPGMQDPVQDPDAQQELASGATLIVTRVCSYTIAWIFSDVDLNSRNLSVTCSQKTFHFVQDPYQMMHDILVNLLPLFVRYLQI